MGEYHVVCHDCTFEWVMETKHMAERYAGRHEHETDHDVEYARIDA